MTLEVFQVIGNKLGELQEGDINFKTTMTIARIIVNLDLKEGRLLNTILNFSGQNYSQKFDFKDSPFCCWGCHLHGHPIQDCPLGVTHNNISISQWEGKHNSSCFQDKNHKVPNQEESKESLA